MRPTAPAEQGRGRETEEEEPKPEHQTVLETAQALSSFTSLSLLIRESSPSLQWSTGEGVDKTASVCWHREGLPPGGGGNASSLSLPWVGAGLLTQPVFLPALPVPGS